MVGNLIARTETGKTKTTGLFDLVIAGLSGAIGFEIFVLLDYAYFHLAGPDIVIALVLGGIINLLIMLSYCELGSAMPKVGAEYIYIKTAYGGIAGFIAGCFRWTASIFAAALATVALVSQLAFLVSAISPQLQTAILNQSWLISILIIVAMASIEIRGGKHSNRLIVIAFIILFAAFIVAGLMGNLSPINLFSMPLPQSTSGVIAATVYIFPIFIGTKALLASATSAKRPEKDIPRGLILSALLVIPLYILLAIVAVGTVPNAEAGQQSSLLIIAANSVFGSYGGILFAIAGIVACLSALGTSLTVQSSIARGMSTDGYLPKKLLSSHPRFGTYYIATIVGAIFIIVLSSLGAIPFLGYAASFGSLLVFSVVNLSLIRLRKTKPHMDRPFKTPLYPFTPIIGFILAIALLCLPLLFGDSTAIEALASGLGLTAIILASYYLRMMGQHRIQIALGGIGIGSGILIMASSIFSIMGLSQTVVPFIPNYIQFLISIILIFTGYLNVNIGAKKKNEKTKNLEY